MAETTIEDVYARKVYDSRGNPTIEVEVFTVGGFGRASAPAGASTGTHEVTPFPKGGVAEAVKMVNEVVAQRIVGMDAADQEAVDGVLHEIDGTSNFSRIGGAATLAVSIATAKAAASSFDMPFFQYIGGAFATELPYPLGNVVGGGKHASERAPNIQEFLIIPVGAKSYSEAIEACFKVHKEVGKTLNIYDKSFAGGRGDEGAWAANISDEEALEALTKACAKVQDDTGCRIVVGVDVAASSLWSPEKKAYILRREGKIRSREEQINYIIELVEKYDLRYVEDPLHEEDFEGFSYLVKSVGDKALICGDDLFTTNTSRIEMGLSLKSANAIIIKPNQVGTLTDAYRAIKTSKVGGLTPVMSHRSGETEDNFISHLAVGFKCPIIKTGVLGGERVLKHNELVRIEEALENVKSMAGLPSQLKR
ncbi:MAG: phosphopyruvate hydratase [Thermoprotei archaeon]|nr:MAG: phosphopyruvate hydratase [Thermoprotei archaeon]RLF21981.1 MAG: phosphopyruvate hydratase [Thermoprotei archaeon]